MSLKDKLENARPAVMASPAIGDTGAVVRSILTTSRTDPVAQLRRNAQETLFTRIGNRLYDSSLSTEQLRAIVVSELSGIWIANASTL